MRGFGPNQSQGPSWLLAVAIFAALLLLLQLLRGSTPAVRPLEEQFAARPPEAGGGDSGAGNVELPPLPSVVGNLARTAAARIGRGSTAGALTPVAQSAELRIEITGLRRSGTGLQITGGATNTGTGSLAISLADFRFTDETGTVYAAQTAAETTLEPGQRAPLELTIPVPNPKQLVLDVEVQGAPPIRMILLQQPQ